MEYQKLLFENENIHLMANFTGITDDIANAENISLCFYAYQKATGRQIFSETLQIHHLRSLYNHLNAISIVKDHTRDLSERFIEASPDIAGIVSGLDNIDPSVLRIVFDKFQEDERILHILSVLTEVEAEHLHAVHKYTFYKRELENLKELLRLEKGGDIVKDILLNPHLSNYIAGQPEKIFQNWIEKNLWIFGVEYIDKYNFREIVPASKNDSASYADLVMKSLDGFLDLIELKRPKYSIFISDHSHHCYRPSGMLSGVIGQSLFYLQKLDEYKSHIESKNPNTKILSPRIRIIAGRSDEFSPEEHNALRMLNSNLNHIQIITYDHLIQYGEQLLSQYSPPPSEIIVVATTEISESIEES